MLRKKGPSPGGRGEIEIPHDRVEVEEVLRSVDTERGYATVERDASGTGRVFTLQIRVEQYDEPIPADLVLPLVCRLQAPQAGEPIAKAAFSERDGREVLR